MKPPTLRLALLLIASIAAILLSAFCSFGSILTGNVQTSFGIPATNVVTWIRFIPKSSLVSGSSWIPNIPVGAAPDTNENFSVSLNGGFYDVDPGAGGQLVRILLPQNDTNTWTMWQAAQLAQQSALYGGLINTSNGIAVLDYKARLPSSDGSLVTNIAMPIPLPLATAFGAVGDGVTDDSAALLAALNAGGCQLVAGRNYVVTNLVPTNSFAVRGYRTSSITQKLGSVGPVIDSWQNRVQADIAGFCIIGQSNGVVDAGQIGIKLWAARSPIVRDMWIQGFNGPAMYVAGDGNIYARSNHFSIACVTVQTNAVGFRFGDLSAAEYGEVTACKVDHSVVGYDVADANLLVTAPMAIDCDTNLWIHPSDGRSHSIFEGVIFNHSTNAMIYATNCQTGFTVSGGHGMGTDGAGNGIYILGSTNVGIAGMFFQIAGTINCQNSSVIWQQNRFMNTAITYVNTGLNWASGNYMDGSGSIDTKLAPNLLSAPVIGGLSPSGAPMVAVTGGIQASNALWMAGGGSGGAELYMFGPNDQTCGLYFQSRWPGAHAAWEQFMSASASGDQLYWSIYPEGGASFLQSMILGTNGNLSLPRGGLVALGFASPQNTAAVGQLLQATSTAGASQWGWDNSTNLLINPATLTPTSNQTNYTLNLLPGPSGNMATIYSANTNIFLTLTGTNQANFHRTLLINCYTSTPVATIAFISPVHKNLNFSTYATNGTARIINVYNADSTGTNVFISDAGTYLP